MPSVNFNNNNFNGKLEGKGAYEYYQAIKGLRKQNAKETIEFIREIIGSEFINDREFVHPFFEKVFIQDGERNEWEGGIKLLLSTSDSLYSDSNIAKLLECMGTMIIESERKRDNPDKYIKVFKSSEMFAKAIDEQNALSQIVNSSSDGKYAKTMGRDDMFVLANQMNYKMEKRRVKLNDKDLEELDKEFGCKYPVVHDYYITYLQYKEEIEKYRNMIKEGKVFSNVEKYKYKNAKKHVKTLKNDFLDAIEKKERPIVFKAPLPDEGNPEWDVFDETDPEHIKAALRINRGNDMQDELSVIIRDLETTVNQCKWTDRQKRILELLKTDMSLSQIAEEVNLNSSDFNKEYNRMCKRIVDKNYEKIEDWYYLNIRYGNYKKCNKCKEVKLISKFNKKGDRLQPNCKNCVNKK